MGQIVFRPAGSRFLPSGGIGEMGEEEDMVVSPVDFAEVPGDEAETALERVRAAVPSRAPVLLGSGYDAELLFERAVDPKRTPSDWAREAKALDLDEWFKTRVDEVRGWQAQMGIVLPERGKWPASTAPLSTLSIARDVLTDDHHEKVLIALLPTADVTLTAGLLRFGGWNDCPLPPVHIRIARDWRDAYGATLVANTYDTLEFRVARPPETRDAALRLAMDHYHYNRESCPDTLQDAAARLIGATVWHFWWE